MPAEIPEPWSSFLADLDALTKTETRLECLGGFVLTQIYGLPRYTADLDSVTINPREELPTLLAAARQGSPLHKKHGVYLDFVTVATVPENYEDRLTEMFPGAFPHLRLFALNAYDLALAKLGRNIQRDRDDVKFLAQKIPFDITLFKRRYNEELRPYVANPQREDLTLQLWIEAIEEERNAT
jgi:hypothetical protein